MRRQLPSCNVSLRRRRLCSQFSARRQGGVLKMAVRPVPVLLLPGRPPGRQIPRAEQ